MNKKLSLVMSVQENYIILKCSDNSLYEFLKNIGAKKKFFNKAKWVLKYRSQEELAKKLEKFRDKNFLFVGGTSGWTPADVFYDFRKKGYVKGTIQEIVWKDKISPIIREM